MARRDMGYNDYMDVVSTTTLRKNFDEVMKRVKKEGYIFISKNRSLKAALVDINLVEALLPASDRLVFTKSLAKAQEEVKSALED